MSTLLATLLERVHLADTIPRTWSWSLPRHFSNTGPRYELSKDPETRRRQLDANNTRNRFRWANDPEFRARLMARMRARNADMEYRAYTAERRRVRCANDTTFLERERNSLRKLRAENATSRQVFRLDNLVRQKVGKERLRWRLHEPIRHDEKVWHDCRGCGLTTTRVLWWRLLSDPTQFECNNCFVKDWPNAIPIGYDAYYFTDEAVEERKLERKAASRGRRKTSK